MYQSPPDTNFTTPMLQGLVEIELCAKALRRKKEGVPRANLTATKSTLDALVTRQVVVCNGQRYKISSIGKMVLSVYRYGRTGCPFCKALLSHR